MDMHRRVRADQGATMESSLHRLSLRAGAMSVVFAVASGCSADNSLKSGGEGLTLPGTPVASTSVPMTPPMRLSRLGLRLGLWSAWSKECRCCASSRCRSSMWTCKL